MYYSFDLSYFSLSVSYQLGYVSIGILYSFNRLKLQKFQNNHSSKNDHVKEKCFVSHQDDPFFLLMPLKVEVIMAGPMNLFMFHSVLSSQQIDEIQDHVDRFKIILVCN